MVSEVVDAQLHATPAGTDDHLPGVRHVGAGELVAAMDEAGVDAGLLVVPSSSGWDNSYSSELAASMPERFRVVGRVDHTADDVADVIERFAADPVSVGLRMLVMNDTAAQQVADRAFDRYLDAATRHGLAVCIYAASYPDAVPTLARQHPDTRFVLDHFGVGGVIPGFTTWESVARDERIPRVLELASLGNVTVKLTGGPSISQQSYPFDDLRPIVERFVQSFGTDRLMWGTDYTRVHNGTYREGVDYLREADWLSPDDAEAIFSQTLRRVFRWPAAQG
jgi:predicted TIM-barrel fold metal-dependent hydrolase